MDYTEILRIGIWPLLILLVVIIFRDSLREMIKNIADFSITKDGFSARVGRKQLNEHGTGNKTDKLPTQELNNKFFSKEMNGKVSFNYSNNDGIYTIGEGNYRFDTQWSKASNEYIHFYNDQPSIKSVRLVKDISNIDEVNPHKYDSSSRARSVGIDQIAIFENIKGNFLLIKVLGIKDDSRGDSNDEVRFSYKILP